MVSDARTAAAATAAWFVFVVAGGCPLRDRAIRSRRQRDTCHAPTRAPALPSHAADVPHRSSHRAWCHLDLLSLLLRCVPSLLLQKMTMMTSSSSSSSSSHHHHHLPSPSCSLASSCDTAPPRTPNTARPATPPPPLRSTPASRTAAASAAPPGPRRKWQSRYRAGGGRAAGTPSDAAGAPRSA